eukprot:7319228-Alexandrium_andersonii.AAC.1
MCCQTSPSRASPQQTCSSLPLRMAWARVTTALLSMPTCTGRSSMVARSSPRASALVEDGLAPLNL